MKYFGLVVMTWALISFSVIGTLTFAERTMLETVNVLEINGDTAASALMAYFRHTSNQTA